MIIKETFLLIKDEVLCIIAFLFPKMVEVIRKVIQKCEKIKHYEINEEKAEKELEWYKNIKIKEEYVFTKKKIIVDISILSTIKFVSGIQRVCNAILQNLIDIYENSEEYCVIPVYSDHNSYLFYRCDYEDGRYVWDRHKIVSIENIIMPYRGDIILFPDCDYIGMTLKREWYKSLKNIGIKIYAIIYDLIPIEYPEFYGKNFAYYFREYLITTTYFTGVISISKATLDAYINWINKENMELDNNFHISYFHLGCDIGKTLPSKLKDDEDLSLINKLKNKTTFLMVSTIEPRKCHKQVLDAFSLLWEKGYDINLVFVGRYGWKMPVLKSRMRFHRERGKHFYWLKGISDEYLQKIYEASDAVIVASLQEGFGLPVVEAAYYGKSLILRNIPVFREVCGMSALYFEGNSPEELVQCLEEYLNAGKRIKAKDIEIVTWKKAVSDLCDKIL